VFKKRFDPLQIVRSWENLVGTHRALRLHLKLGFMLAEIGGLMGGMYLCRNSGCLPIQAAMTKKLPLMVSPINFGTGLSTRGRRRMSEPSTMRVVSKNIENG